MAMIAHNNVEIYTPTRSQNSRSIDMNHRAIHVYQLIAKLALEQHNNLWRIRREGHADDVFGIRRGGSGSHGVDKSAGDLRITCCAS
jgi:tryptophan 2,3-dioxygenase